MLNILFSIIEQGLIFSLVLAAVYLSSKVISFDDLSVEGSFGAGGALIAFCALVGLNSFIAFLLAVIFGVIIGTCTGTLHTKLKMNNLISGIVVTTALYSINLKLAGSHLALNPKFRIFNFSDLIFGIPKPLLILLPLCILILILLKWFLTTEIGFLLRAVGTNTQIITSLGKSISFYKILGLAISNALTALAGALFVQYMGFFSITASLGILVIALAGLTLGEVLEVGLIGGILLGAISYPLILTLIFELQLDPVWNKLAIALFIVVLLMLKKRQNKVSIR